ncbi:MAG: VanZ family protein [Ruminococcus sp.]|nr:VanZ family protein [Ruminococcus sp.]
MEIIGEIRHYILPSTISAIAVCTIWFTLSLFFKKRADLTEWLCRFLLIISLSAIVIITEGYKLFTEGITNVFIVPNLLPITQTIEALNANSVGMSEQILYNIVLFIPFGFFLPFSFAKVKWKQWKLVLIAVSVILIVETMELLSGRYFDIDDVIFNIVGAVCGYLDYQLVCFIHKHTKKNTPSHPTQDELDKINKQNDDFTIINTMM